MASNAKSCPQAGAGRRGLAGLAPCLVLLLALGLGLVPWPAAAQEPVTGDGIVVGTIGDATSMIPMLTSDAASHEMGGQCYNAHDALFNWRFMTDPNTPTPYSGDYLNVDQAEALDEYTFRVHYKEPFAPGLTSWTLAQMPAHLLEGQDPRKSPLNRHPIGTGPYQFKSWSPGAKVELRAFHDYWEGRPFLDSLVYRVIPDMATLFLELRSGGVDWMGLTALQYRRQTETEAFRRDFKKYRYLAAAYNYIGWNLRDKRFQDRRVRQALSYAVNKEEIIEGVLLGLGQECTGPLKSWKRLSRRFQPM